MTTPLHNNPYPEGHEILLCSSLLYILSLYDLMLALEKRILKKKNIFHYYDHALAQEHLPRGIIIRFVWSMPGSNEEDFQRNNAFSLNV